MTCNFDVQKQEIEFCLFENDLSIWLQYKGHVIPR
jgi:hypothetical protein